MAGLVAAGDAVAGYAQASRSATARLLRAADAVLVATAPRMWRDWNARGVDLAHQVQDLFPAAAQRPAELTRALGELDQARRGPGRRAAATKRRGGAAPESPPADHPRGRRAGAVGRRGGRQRRRSRRVADRDLQGAGHGFTAE